MKFEVGAIVTGKVTGIAKFGAFVELAPGKSGLVYISEISEKYIKDVSEHLAVGQEVTVKIIGIDKSGKISLSIKQALPPNQKYTAKSEDSAPENSDFEDKLKKFMKESDSHLSDIRRQNERHGLKRRR